MIEKGKATNIRLPLGPPITIMACVRGTAAVATGIPPENPDFQDQDPHTAAPLSRSVSHTYDSQSSPEDKAAVKQFQSCPQHTSKRREQTTGTSVHQHGTQQR